MNLKTGYTPAEITLSTLSEEGSQFCPFCGPFCVAFGP